MSAPMIAPSILSADFAHLGEDIEKIAKADRIHVDVMDGHFVPNLSFGPGILETVRRLTDQHLDVHLMIEEPEKWVDTYIDAGADTVIFHLEAARNPVKLAQHIRERGVKAAISIKPNTPVENLFGDLREYDQILIMSVEPGFGGQAFMPEQLNKVRTLRPIIDEHSLDLLIEIDGGINADTIGQAAEAGVDIFVAGSAVYSQDDPGQAIEHLRKLATIK